MKKDNGQAWKSNDGSSSHWTDDSWTPDAGWFCTKAHTAWMVATPLNLAKHPTHVALDLGCTLSIGSRSAIERFKKHAWNHGITTEFCRCKESFVFANSETETCMESYIVHFPTIPPCSTKVDVLETGDVLSLRCNSWVRLLNWIQKETKLHVQLLVCIPIQLSTPQWDIFCWT